MKIFFFGGGKYGAVLAPKTCYWHWLSECQQNTEETSWEQNVYIGGSLNEEVIPAAVFNVFIIH